MSMNREECIKEAVTLFGRGANCAESTLTAVSHLVGVEDARQQMATGFGGGLGRCKSLCGAVAGGIMAIGQAHGRKTTEDVEAKEKTYSLVGDFHRRFIDEFETDNCFELIGYDLSDPEDVRKCMEEKVFETKCRTYVETSVSILYDLLH